MKRRFPYIAVSCLLVLLLGQFAAAQEWTRFRGPNGTGVSDATTIPVEWTEKDFNWKTKLPGTGHSSPVVWGEKVFLLSADPDNATRYVLCINAKSGEIEWQRDFKSETHRLHLRSSYASSTPAVDAERVYVAWSKPDKTTLMALDHDGNTVWERDLGRFQSQHGFGTSPIIYNEMLILHNSQQATGLREDQLQLGEKPGKGFMMAFDRKTGKDIWSTPLESTYVCYSVPFIYSPPNGGADELVCTSMGNGVFSLDLETGKFNWSSHDGTEEKTFSMRTVASPILAGGLIFGSTGSGAYSGNYVAAVRPGKGAKVEWTLKNSGRFKAPYVACMLEKDGAVFMLYDRGFASCADAKTGQLYWSDRSGADFNGSPVLVRDKIYSIDEEGVVWVIAADTREFRVLAKNPLGEGSHSTPAVSGGRMFLRTFSHLISVGG